jgi:uroporphyrinogen-III synthase
LTKTAALFRAEEDAAESAARLAALGISAVIAPAFEAAALPASPPQGPFDVVIATSAKAFELAGPTTLAAAQYLEAYVVGEKTLRAAERAGLNAKAPALPDAAALTRKLVDGVCAPARLLYLAGRDRKSDLERALAAAGLSVATLEVYEMRVRKKWRETEIESVARAEAALHYSRRSAEASLALARHAGLGALWRNIAHIAISHDAAAPLSAAGAKDVVVAAAANEAAMFVALKTVLRERGGAK